MALCTTPPGFPVTHGSTIRCLCTSSGGPRPPQLPTNQESVAVQRSVGHLPTRTSPIARSNGFQEGAIAARAKDDPIGSISPNPVLNRATHRGNQLGRNLLVVGSSLVRGPGDLMHALASLSGTTTSRVLRMAPRRRKASSAGNTGVDLCRILDANLGEPTFHALR